MKYFILLNFILFFFASIFSQDSTSFDLEKALLGIKMQTNDSLKFDSLLQVAIQNHKLYDFPPNINSKQSSRNKEAFNCESENWGFEDGTTNNWTTAGYTEIVSTGTDPYGNYPWLCPSGGGYSVKISGDEDSQANGSISRTIDVPALGTTYFSFHFAMSIFNYPHYANAASKFYVEFFDQNNNLIPCPNFVCYYSSDNGPQGVNNFQSTPNSASSYNSSADGDSPGSYGVTYTPWNDVTLDLSGYAGQTITVRFMIRWCAYGPDWSYALVDIDCPTNNADPIDKCEDLPYQLCGPKNMGSYTWYNATNPNLGNQECYTVTEAGTYYCDVLPSNVACSAGSIVTYEYKIKENPKAGFTIQDHCNGEVMPLTNTSFCPTQNSCNYSWVLGDGSVIPNSFEPEYIYNLPNDYTVTLTSTTDQGCTSDSTLQVTVLEEPIAAFNVDDECLYTPLSFNNTSTISDPSVLNSWTWDFGDGSPLNSTEFPSHIYPSEGLYNVSLIVLLNNGCVDTANYSPTVYPIPVANFTSTTICENEPPTEFSNQSTIVSGSIVTFGWEFGDLNVSSLPNPKNQYAQFGVYNTQLIVTSNFGCKDTTSNSVIVLEKPNVEFSSDIKEDCSPACVNFSDLSSTSSVNTNEWNWSFGNGRTSTWQNPFICFENSSRENDSSFYVQLIATNELGCRDTIRKENFITSYHYPISQFEITPPETNMYLTEISFVNNSVGADLYHWDFDEGTESEDFEPTLSLPDTGSFNIELIANTIHNCSDTSYNSIKVGAVTNFYVPNTFTPNGDGVNDVFIPKFYNIDNIKLSIFDKWGTLVFYTEDLKKGWDGTYKGVVAKSDTYVWKISTEDGFGEVKDFKGHIFLMR